MRKFLTAASLVALLGCLALPARAEENIPLKIAGNVLLLADWNQTRYIAGHPEEFFERNPALGKHPSKQRVDAYFAGVILALNGADLLLGPKISDGLWIGVVVIESAAVANNVGIGVRFGF